MRKLALLLVFILALTGTVFAESDINVILEQPAVSVAKSGDRLNYNLVVKLPEGYQKKYQAFYITVLMDQNLTVEKTNLIGGKVQAGNIVVKVTRENNTGQNYITFNTYNFNNITDSTLKLEIEATVKKDIKTNRGLNNSFVLSYAKKDGTTGTDQKNLSSSTMARDGVLTVKDVFTTTQKIEGVADSQADITVLNNGKKIGEGKADSKGNFSIAVKDLKENDQITVVSMKKDNKLVEMKIVKAPDNKEEVKSEEKKEETAEKSKVSSSQKTMEMLQDFVNYGKELNVSRVDKEDGARLMAALAQGQYVMVKSDVTSNDISSAIDLIAGAVQKVRYPYMSGVTKNKFEPQKALTRAQTASIFRRLTVGDKVVQDFPTFADVKGDAWYAPGVATMERKSLISGYQDNTFRPEKEITRAEFASIVARYLQISGGNRQLTFRDVKENFWAYDAIDALVTEGILSGRSAEKFDPNAPMKRSEAAVIINRITNRKADKAFLDKYAQNPYTDVKKDFWAYYEILEVTGQ